MKPALLLVDLQADYLAAADLQPVADQLVGRAGRLLDRCRELSIPVIHVWTTVRRDDDHRLLHWRLQDRWQCVDGTTGHRPPPGLEPREGESVIHKSGFNAFAGGMLDDLLRRLDRDAVILAGLHLHTCVRLAAMECLERGYRVHIAEDAIASNDPIHAAATLRWLTERSVRFAPASAILASLAGGQSALVHRSPRCTNQVLFEVRRADEATVSAEIEQARGGWLSWRFRPAADRLAVLEAAAGRLESAATDLAHQMAIEIGKPISHGLEESRRGAANVRDVIRRAAAFQSETRESGGITRRQPLGVIALISPWNNPVAIPIGKIAPALAYGNTIVWKPAPSGTGIARAILRILHQAGLPSNVVRLIEGDSRTAQQIASHQDIDAVTLTGSLSAGYAIEEICARRFIPLQAELGGNNPAIVWPGSAGEDTDLAHAAKQIAWGAFGFAGQRCTANRRAIVAASEFEQFLAALKTAAEQLPWGDPFDTTTEIGPVINTAKQQETAALIDRALHDDRVATVHLVQAARAAHGWVREGSYSQPAIICCDDATHPLVQEETMSPILVVQRAKDFDHAIELADGTRYGLAAALFSNNAALRDRFLAGARAGILKLNTSTAGADTTLPFGGWKASGVGPPEHGEADVLFFTRLQAVYGG